MVNKLFGHAFVCDNELYYYDANKNTIIKISKSLFKEIYNTNKNNVTNHSDEYCALQKKGYFRYSPIRKVELGSFNELKGRCERNIVHLILQTTQQCNFKCRYCTFAGDGSIERTHTNKTMTFDTAKHAIEFLFKHSADSKEVLISFYGGEPLLEFELIKNCILYSEKLFLVKKCVFAIATNASLLNQDMVHFFVNHNVQLDISLDGPEDVQNFSRRYAANGKGTFGNVHEKMVYILNEYPNYYDQYVYYHPVISPNSDISRISAFFENELHTDDNHVMLSNINTSGLNIIFDLNGDIQENNSLLGAESKFTDFFDSVYMDKRPISHTYHHGGPCVPGSKKLFVSTDGLFYPCEKVNEQYSNNVIGNIHDGFDYNRIYNLYNIGALTESKCKSCWCIRYCKMCIADIQGCSIEQTIKNKTMACEYQQRRALDMMKMKINTSK